MQENANENIYQVIKIEKTTAPAGMPGNDWYLYVIQRGNLDNSVMECKKTGTLESVTEHANTVAETINSRIIKGGRK